MRFPIWAMAVLVVGSLFAASQEIASQPNPTVSGVVVAGDTGLPLPKAKVVLAAQASLRNSIFSGISAPDGTFSFRDVPPGPYYLMAERTGYVELRGKERLSLTVTSGSEIKNLRLQLTPWAVIAGKVVNEDGEPVVNANVEALRRRYGPRGPVLAPVGNAATNDLGEYRIFGLPPGRYILRVIQQERWTSAESKVKDPDADLSYPPLYYPETTNADAVVPYELRAGAEGRADFQLARISGVTIRGQITGIPKSDQPIHAQVMLHTGSQRVAGTQVREDGTFEIRGVAPGTYSLDTWAPQWSSDGGQPTTWSAHRKLVVSSGQPEELTLALQQQFVGEVQGQVRVEGSAAKLDQIHVVLEPAVTEDEGLNLAFGWSSRPGYGSVKADGSFKIQLRGHGKYRAVLSANGPGLEDYYTKAVSYGGHDITDTGFNFTGNAAPLEIVVSSAGARIEGSVVDDDGKPIRDATVVAVPDKGLRDRRDLYQPTRTDQTGHFVIRGQRPGNYTVLALDDVRDPIYMDPAWLKDNEDKGQSLRAEVNGRHQLSLKVIAVQQTD